jgi:hypothetical protein
MTPLPLTGRLEGRLQRVHHAVRVLDAVERGDLGHRAAGDRERRGERAGSSVGHDPRVGAGARDGAPDLLGEAGGHPGEQQGQREDHACAHHGDEELPQPVA